MTAPWTAIAPILMLVASNVFMTFAWYGHLKVERGPLWLIVMASWGIAFFEYWLAVPANRIGRQVYDPAELKAMEWVALLLFLGVILFLLAGFPVAFSLAGTGLGLIVSAMSSRQERAVGAVPLLILPQILFSKFAIPEEHFGDVVKVVEKAMPVRWAFRVFEECAAKEPKWHLVAFSLVVLLAYAGLSAIPDAFYQAAKIDGASRWQPSSPPCWWRSKRAHRTSKVAERLIRPMALAI